MGEVAMSAPGLLAKISSLYNNPLYSDVEFAFGSDAGEKIYCHKLILSLRSKAFSHMFFESENSLSVVRLPASKRTPFTLLFKFMYTDEIKFNTYDEAQDLLVLANEFSVEELVQKCHSYLSQNKLTINNVFSRYESALQRFLDILLKDCRNFVCSNIQQILASDSFTNASLAIVEDIVKQDNLCVSSELEIIEAVLKWGSANLKENNICDEKLLRAYIKPLMKYLRILALEIHEFEYLVEHYNIFTSHESMILTRKILLPESDVILPDDICKIAVARNTDQSKLSNVKQPVQSNQSNRSKSVNFESPDHLNDNKTLYEVKKCKPESSEFVSEINQIAYEVKQSILKDSKRPPLRMQQNKFKPSTTKEKNYPMPIFASGQGVSQTRLRSYEFFLQENETSFTSSFRNDLSSSISFRMKSGNLSLYGLELKVKNRNISSEALEVDVYLKGFSKESFSQKYKQELKNGVIIIKFPKLMKLREGSKGELEVSIEDMYLNRFYACVAKSPFELNSGQFFSCEFSIESNRKDDSGGILFMISKLIYIPS